MEKQMKDVMTCLKCGSRKLSSRQHEHVQVLGARCHLTLRAARLKCSECGNEALSYCDEHLRQLEAFLRSGQGDINVHIVHITGNIHVTHEAYMVFTRMCAARSFASAETQWEELQLDAYRCCFERAHSTVQSGTVQLVSRTDAETLIRLYKQLCQRGHLRIARHRQLASKAVRCLNCLHHPTLPR
eukprot:jgi/Ulvmu1/4663/UM002_0394.1